MATDIREQFEPVPLQEPVPVRKRRGRPPKTDQSEPTPRRRTRRANLETRVGAFITRVNVVFQMAAAFVPAIHPDDPLAPYEIVALAKALTAQADKSPTFRRYLELAISTSDAADLVFVLGAIAVRRAANHGIVPQMIGTIASATLENPEALGSLLQMQTQEEPTDGTV
jgi:hypothetical protein